MRSFFYLQKFVTIVSFSIIVINNAFFFILAKELPSVAICFAGELRTFEMDDVQRSLKLAVLDQINADLYFQVSVEYASAYSQNISSHYITSSNVSYTEAIIESLHPISSMISTSKSLETHVKWINDDQKYLKINMKHILHLSFRWGLCMDAIEEKEVAREKKYDWILLLRPDIIFLCKLPSGCFLLYNT